MFRQAQCGGQLAPGPERCGGAGPDQEMTVPPEGHGRPGLQRDMGDVGGRVLRRQPHWPGCEGLVDVTLFVPEYGAEALAVDRVRPQVAGELMLAGLRRAVPGGVDGLDRQARTLPAAGHDPDELAISD